VKELLEKNVSRKGAKAQRDFNWLEPPVRFKLRSLG
jgi:hypothetical protein